MNDNAISQIRELLDRAETIGIVVGKNPNADEMGAALALYLSLKTSGKYVSAASATEPLVELSNLVGIDRVRDTFEGEGGDLIVSFPYREGEIDKVSYTLEDGVLNIVVKPGDLGLSFTEQDVIFRRKGEYPQLIFTIGVPRISDLNSVFDVANLKTTKLVNIDNKPENQGFGDVASLTNESSISEEVTRLISALGFEMDLDVCQNLLSGISAATENFQNPNTTPLAFEMAGMLMEKGAVRKPAMQSRPEFAKENPGQVLQQLSQSQRHGQQRGQQRRFEKGRSFPNRNQNPSASSGQGQNQNQNQQQQQQQRQGQNPSLQNPPEEWLTPKVYKGSTNV